MHDGAYFINVASGAMVDHDALAEALTSGKLRGEALDVAPQEPLPPDSPLWKLPNAIITPPHCRRKPPLRRARVGDISSETGCISGRREYDECL